MGLIDQFKSLFSKKKKDNTSLIEGEYFQKDSPIDPISQQNQAKNEDLVEKTREFISGTVDEVKQQGSFLWNEVKEQAGQIEESTREFRENIKQKAHDAVEKIEDFVDTTLEKAKALEEQERKENPDKDGDGFADKPIDFGASEGEKHQDFFKKAEAWLDNASQTDATGPALKNTQGMEPLELPKDPDETEQKTAS